MRQTRTDQSSGFDLFTDHESGKELKAISTRRNQHREFAEWVAAADL